MNFIITAGGTSEKIDNVRSITNSSTGALGAKISEAIHSRFPDAGIYYVCGTRAFVPAFPEAKIIRITDTDSLLAALTNLLSTVRTSAVIHAMAVSDYRLRNVSTSKKLAEILSAKLIEVFPDKLPESKTLKEVIEAGILDDRNFQYENKISSDLENPLIILEKTPKVIGYIKKLQPDTILVGFKLLSSVSKEVLVDTAHALLLTNKCDLVFANDTDGMKEGSHSGYLVDPYKNTIECHGKENIAEVITNQLAELLKAKGENL
jgi:phosphopantothenate-cysteine ligase